MKPIVQQKAETNLPASMAVVIVNHNTCEHLRACLLTVQQETMGEVIVVDNQSTDKSVEMVRADFPWVELQANTLNNGYGAAANQAIARCQSPYVLVLNSDTRLHPGALRALTGYLDRNPRAAVVGPRLMNMDGSLQRSCYPFPTPLHVFLEETTLNRLIGRVPLLRERSIRTWSHGRDRAAPWVLGAALALRRDAFLEAGGFNPSFFMFAEEIDLCYRLFDRGWETHFTPAARVTHMGGASIRQYRAEMAEQFFHSMVLFYKLHYSPAALRQFLTLMKMIVFARLVRDTARLPFAANAEQYAWILEGITAWRNILFRSKETLETVENEQ